MPAGVGWAHCALAAPPSPRPAAAGQGPPPPSLAWDRPWLRKMGWPGPWALPRLRDGFATWAWHSGGPPSARRSRLTHSGAHVCAAARAGHPGRDVPGQEGAGATGSGSRTSWRSVTQANTGERHRLAPHCLPPPGVWRWRVQSGLTRGGGARAAALPPSRGKDPINSKVQQRDQEPAKPWAFLITGRGLGAHGLLCLQPIVSASGSLVHPSFVPTPSGPGSSFSLFEPQMSGSVAEIWPPVAAGVASATLEMEAARPEESGSRYCCGPLPPPGTSLMAFGHLWAS